jgi:outer membrane protein
MGLPIPIFIVLLITTIVPLSAHAENSSSIGEIKMQGASLSFEEAVRRGLVRHPLIRISEHEVAQIEAGTKQLEAANYPRVTGVFANSAGDTRVLANLGISGSLPKPTNYLTTPGLRVDLLITDFGHTAHKILANKAVAASAQKNVLTTKAVVILTIEQAYLNCLKQQRFVDIAREVLKERELIRAQTESLYRNQLRSKLDVDFASVEANRAELAVIKSPISTMRWDSKVHTNMHWLLFRLRSSPCPLFRNSLSKPYSNAPNCWEAKIVFTPRKRP